MTPFKIKLIYDGTSFVGWQRQASGTSIQGLVEEALRELDGREVPVAGAGRTDAGVHALGQVASFSLAREIDAATVARALNARLPFEIRVIAAEQTAASFHARFSACAKVYRYRIWNGDVISPFDHRYAWHVTATLDLDAMARAARQIEGEHDFAGFQASGGQTQTTVRRVRQSAISADGAWTSAAGGSMICYDIAGDGFLRHMVRAIAGSLVEVGRGRRPPDWISDLLAGGSRRAAGPTAPARGLFLTAVEYSGALAAEP